MIVNNRYTLENEIEAAGVNLAAHPIVSKQ